MSRSKRNGISKIEVLVVLGISGIMVGMMMPATRRVSSERVRCTNNMRQIGIGLQLYHDVDRPAPATSAAETEPASQHSFPPGCLGPKGAPEERLSWMVAVLPFIEQNHVYQQFNVEKGYADNSTAAATVVKPFICRAAKYSGGSEAVTHYVAIAGVRPDAATQPAGAKGNGFMGYDRFTNLKMIEDGTSNTIALMETRAAIGPWARGGNSTLRGFDPAKGPPVGDGNQFGGHVSGAVVGLADGSARTISPTMSAVTFAAATTIAGREELGTDW